MTTSSVPASSKEVAIIVTLGPEIERLLQENHTDVVSLLRQEVEDFRVAGIDDLPTGVIAKQQGTKEVFTILIGSAVLAVALAPTLKRLIEAFANQPVVVEEAVWVPVESTSGEVVRDAAGAPVLQRVVRHKLLETQRSSTASTEKLSLEGPMDVKISYETVTG
jgi:hypothetical protein